MASQRKTNHPPTEDGPVLQLSSHQLTLAISALLVVACLLFLLGGFAFSYDRAFFGEKAESFPEPGEVQRPAPNPVTNAKAPVQGVQQSPRRVEPIAKKESPASKPAAPGNSSKSIVDIPAPTGGNNAVPANKPQDPVKPAPVITEPVPEMPEIPEDKPELPKEVAMADPKPTDPVPADPAPVADTKPEDAADSKPESSAGNFVIQLAAFASNNQKGADKFQRDVLEKYGLIVKLAPSPDGKHLRAHLGPYGSRAEAETALAGVKDHPEFKGCFVKAGDK
ncbi:MAG: hypothetical protein AMXMBFR84_33840 [Candidatus Hydrogenedentota bacterium]